MSDLRAAARPPRPPRPVRIGAPHRRSSARTSRRARSRIGYRGVAAHGRRARRTASSATRRLLRSNGPSARTVERRREFRAPRIVMPCWTAACRSFHSERLRYALGGFYGRRGRDRPATGRSSATPPASYIDQDGGPRCRLRLLHARRVSRSHARRGRRRSRAVFGSRSPPRLRAHGSSSRIEGENSSVITTRGPARTVPTTTSRDRDRPGPVVPGTGTMPLEWGATCASGPRRAEERWVFTLTAGIGGIPSPAAASSSTARRRARRMRVRGCAAWTGAFELGGLGTVLDRRRSRSSASRPNRSDLVQRVHRRRRRDRDGADTLTLPDSIRFNRTTEEGDWRRRWALTWKLGQGPPRSGVPPRRARARADDDGGGSAAA